MQSLIIVESPTKARTLARFLGGKYQIEATFGHIRDLPEKKLGVTIVQKEGTFDFIPSYQPIAGRKTKITELKKAAQSAEQIILATDPDREGEAIAYHVRELLDKSITSSTSTTRTTSNKKNKALDTLDTRGTRGTFQRIVFHEITQSAIQHAISNPHEIDMQLVDAQQARRLLDRLVGYKLSPLLWNKLGKNWLSAGRVQSVAVRLIVDREREIEAFNPVEYWMVQVELAQIQSSKFKVQNQNEKIKTVENQNESFLAKLVELDGKKVEIPNKDTADIIIQDLKQATYTVEKVEKKEVRKYPLPPFTTSTLQQLAANRFGWTAKRTMRSAQQLYEEGFITYHRTDSTNLSFEAIQMVRVFIPRIYGDLYLSSQTRIYKTKSKVAQEAHEAIRPTETKILGFYDLKKLPEDIINKNDLKALPQDLGRDAELLYSIIFKRFVACQMSEAVFDQTSVTIKGINEKQYTFKVGGQAVKFAGWRAVYGDIKNNKLNIKNNEEDREEKEEEELNQLPQLTESEPLNFIQVNPQQKFTEPPPRYNEASLIKILEEKGIGRPSTYAPIISTIQDRKYVEKIERRFHPTDLGKTVNDFLVKYFHDLFDISFTAKLEDELDDIANGTFQWKQVLSDFYTPFKATVDHVFLTAEKVKMDLGKTDEKCPTCGSGLVIRMSKYGKFLACSTFPTCKFTKNIVEKVGIPCPKCASDIILKRTKRGKQFYGCSNYPACTFAAWKKEDIK